MPEDFKMCLLLMTILTFTSIKYLAIAQTERQSREPTFYDVGSNWTSCEKFVENTQFDPKSVVNIDWKIFYFWNPDIEESYNIRFSWPAPMLIDRFKRELDEEMKPPINWTNAELFMEATIDFSALCIKTSTPGIYSLIPSLAFYQKSIPPLIFAFKLTEPGYLGIENCKYRIAYALAPVDKMPYHYELENAARTLKFHNNYNRTHIDVGPLKKIDEPFAMDLSDDELDELMETEDDFAGKINFI